MEKHPLKITKTLDHFLEADDFEKIKVYHAKGNIQQFLTMFKLPSMENEPLIIKRIEGSIERGSVFKQFTPVMIIFTIDMHVILLDFKEK